MSNKKDFLAHLGFSTSALSAITGMQGKIAIVGAGQLGVQMSEHLAKEFPSAVYYDINDPEILEKLRESAAEIVIRTDNVPDTDYSKFIIEPGIPPVTYTPGETDLSPLSSLQKNHKRYKRHKR